MYILGKWSTNLKNTFAIFLGHAVAPMIDFGILMLQTPLL